MLRNCCINVLSWPKMRVLRCVQTARLRDSSFNNNDPSSQEKTLEPKVSDEAAWTLDRSME